MSFGLRPAALSAPTGPEGRPNPAFTKGGTDLGPVLGGELPFGVVMLAVAAPMSGGQVLDHVVLVIVVEVVDDARAGTGEQPYLLVAETALEGADPTVVTNEQPSVDWRPIEPARVTQSTNRGSRGLCRAS